MEKVINNTRWCLRNSRKCQKKSALLFFCSIIARSLAQRVTSVKRLSMTVNWNSCVINKILKKIYPSDDCIKEIFLIIGLHKEAWQIMTYFLTPYQFDEFYQRLNLECLNLVIYISQQFFQWHLWKFPFLKFPAFCMQLL